MKIKKAVIVTNGRRDRFLPITKAQPKEMLPLVDRPLIQHFVEEAVICGVELVIIVTTPGNKAIEDHFDRNTELESFLGHKGKFEMLRKIRRLSDMADICYVRRKSRTGLGDALLTVRNLVGNEPFMFILTDELFDRNDLLLRRMVQIYEQYCSSVIALRRVSDDRICRYGIVNTRRVEESIYEINEIIEKPGTEVAASDMAIVGRYVFMPEVFRALESLPQVAGGEIRLTDALAVLMENQALHGFLFDGERYDVGSPLGLTKATIAQALMHPEMGEAIRAYISSLYIMPEVHSVT